jgi:N-methylhydantoinase B
MTTPLQRAAPDLLTLMVIKGALEQVADEMDATLFRTSLSTVISEGHDASHGIYHPQTGETVVQGKLGLPVFVGTMQSAVRAVIDKYGDTLEPGDTILFNDPYAGGTHLQDTKVVRPVFVDGRRFCFLASDAHLIDIGGPVPGGFNASARNYWQEGLFLGPVHLSRGDVINDDILALFGWNTRLPEWTMADVLSQYQTLRMGEARLLALVETHGADVVQAATEELADRAERVMRSHIAELPDGTYRFHDFLDNDGQVAERTLTITLEATVSGDELTLDFSGSDRTSPGPLNISRPTLNAACYVALKHLFPDVIANAGCLRPVEIVVPDGTLLTAMPPAPVGGYLEVTTRVVDVIFGALGQAVPELSYAGSYGSVNTLAISGRDDADKPFVLFTWFGGGLGASARGDGLNHGPGPISTAVLQPVETLESRYPIVFERFALRPDSCGRGRFRGGLGSEYSVRVEADEAEVSIMGDRGRFPPHALAGGSPAALNAVEIQRSSGEIDRPEMISKWTAAPVARGDKVVIRSAGGGGYGPPQERDPAAIERDLRLGYLTGWEERP